VFKPEEARMLRALANDRSTQVLQVGLQRRYSQFYRMAQQMVVKGMLGEVTHIKSQWHLNPGWIMKPDLARDKNWRLFREFSGGLTAELVSHQIDLANWMFDDTPQFVTGVGGLDWRKDGRDIYDDISLILRYPHGQKLNATSIGTNHHLALFGGARKEAGELILGTEGSIEITLGDEHDPPFALWFVEPGAKVERAEGRTEPAFFAGATAAKAGGDLRGYPILLRRDFPSDDDSFLKREMKYARRWLYAKGIEVPEEERNPVETQMEEFFQCCRTGVTPKADLDAGLNVSAFVILANLAMDEGRRVRADEFDRLVTS
jgi:predicted dehydrogenase